MTLSNPMTPLRQIRAYLDSENIRIYQAYSNNIADSALANGTFVSPPFKLERMTWIKPSFLWMMYRCGWGFKDSHQNRVLAIDISREGFEWALRNSLISHRSTQQDDREAWAALKKITPVRVQWDPERDLNSQALEYRSIQIGLSNEAVTHYVNHWIQHITDFTELAHEIHATVESGNIDAACQLLPVKKPHPIGRHYAVTY